MEFMWILTNQKEYIEKYVLKCVLRMFLQNSNILPIEIEKSWNMASHATIVAFAMQNV